MKGGREEETRGSSSPQETRGSTSVCLPLLGEEEDFGGNYVENKVSFVADGESECFTLESAETKPVFTSLDYQS